ncbi:MAG: flagellar protein FliS [Planctomycetes bacterium]|nr:flagellar protein FliS [Planctomycetota bacterium]
MHDSARNAYLEAQVRTATPQRLRLMLIDGALRFARLTQTAIRDANGETAFEAGSRLRQVLLELIVAIRRDGNAVAERTLALYVYLFKTATEAQLHSRSEPYDDLIRILEIERGTWQLVCERHPEALQSPIDAGRKEVVATGTGAILPPMNPNSPVSAPGAFSLDA